MALAPKSRKSTDTPPGNRQLPKHVLGESINSSIDQGASIPFNPSSDITGITPAHPVLAETPKRHAIVDTQYVPLSHIIVNAEGDRWYVCYYSQFLGMNDELMPHDVDSTGAHQQYRKINNFILHVINPLDQSQDSETKEFNVTGQSTVFFGLVPNVGDMFIADIGNGDAGLFTVTETERLTYSKEACYRINYRLIERLTETTERSLDAKVNATYYFDIGLVELHDTPYLTENDYLAYNKLEEQDAILRKYFSRMFWSPHALSLAVPQQAILTHDAYHANFCYSIGLSDIDTPIIVYNNGYTEPDDFYCIWNAVRDLSADELTYAHPTFGIAAASNFYEFTVARGIAWSQYAKTVYPTPDFNSGVNSGIRIPVSTIKPSNVMEDEVEPVLDRPTQTWPTIGYSKSYVFSEAFYKQDVALLTKFEKVALEMLQGRLIDSSDVALFCNSVRKLTHLQQFYFIPIILVMIKYVKRGSK